MTKWLSVLALAGVVFGLSAAWAADAPLKSGPQVGDAVPGPFEPFNVNGPSAGEEACLYCRFGPAPVVMVFARDTSAPLTTLLKKLDEATAQNKATEMGTCAVFCSADSTLKGRLKELADKESLKNLVLSVEKPAGPEDYKISADADVTVLLYAKRVVKANHTFRKGELTEKGIEQVVADLSKIVPATK